MLDRQTRQSAYLAALVNVATCYGHRAASNGLRIAMMTAYFDESGIHKGDHLCVVAGYMGSDAQWIAFVKDWISVLGKRRNLHMHDLRWNKPKKVRELLDRLGPLPEKHKLTRIVGGVWQKDHADLIKGKLRPRFSSPYVLSAMTCMSNALRALPKSQELLVVFDRQHVYQSTIDSIYDVVFDNLKFDRRVKPPQFSNKKHTVCLDPADFLAFAVYETASNRTSPKARAARSILANGECLGEIYTRQKVASYVGYALQHGMGIDGDTKGKFTYEEYLKVMGSRGMGPTKFTLS